MVVSGVEEEEVYSGMFFGVVGWLAGGMRVAGESRLLGRGTLAAGLRLAGPAGSVAGELLCAVFPERS